MFLKNLNILVEKGINICGLIESNILKFDFDFDEWPSQHTDDNKYLRPYNGSIFDIQFAYDTIFHEKGLQDVIGNIDDLSAGVGIDASRVYKIRYTLNLILSFGQHMSPHHRHM